MNRLERLPPLDCPYNVSFQEYWSDVPPEERPDDDGDWMAVRSVETLPPVGSQEQERGQLVPILTALLNRYLGDFDIPRLNSDHEEVFGESSVGQFPTDREMRFFLDHPAAFTPELIRRLQAMLSDQFPLWRVVPQFKEVEVGVYPDGVRFDFTGEGTLLRESIVRGRLEDADPRFLAWSQRVHRRADQTREDDLPGTSG